MLALSTLAPMAVAAEINGKVTDAAGTPLYRAPLCLQIAAGSPGCIKRRFSDRKGEYAFNGLKTGQYTVSIVTDKSPAARKLETYRTFVWSASQTAVIDSKNGSVLLSPFIGKFNYSNYQRVIELEAGNFPELAQVDLAAEPVFLKVAFMPVSSPEVAPETIFLGQVTDPASLRLQASLPLAVTGIDYQVFSAAFSYTGRITLAD